MKKIALYGKFSENMIRALEDACPEEYLTYAVPPEETEKLGQADIMVCRGAAIDKAVLDRAPKLGLIQKWGAGYDNLDIEEAGKRGIPVSVCSGGNRIPVAELTVALMLNVLRNVIPLNEGLKQGRWERERFMPRSGLLHGKTVGLLGFGSIAREVADIVIKGFKCSVIYYDVLRPDAGEEERCGVKYVPIDDLFKTSDIVSIHIPLLKENENMVDRKKLASMKPTAVLINTARGGVVNEKDLFEALKTNQILGAGLDTFQTEPVPRESPLLLLENVAATPHCGGNTADNDKNMAELCMENIKEYTCGNHSLSCLVNGKYLS